MDSTSDRPPSSRPPPQASEAPPGLAPGTVIDRRYRIDKSLGAGGMGLVMQATHTVTGRVVAIKVVRPEFAFTRDIVERFEREAQVLALVDHPSVVRMYDVGTLPDGALYLAMELLRGETLRDRMRRERPMSPTDLLPLVKSVAAGLDAIHARGIIHRDLKPANVFLPDEAAPGAEAKLVDFGISKLTAPDMRLTRTGEIIGTPRYMAPEQLSERGEIDRRVDVYAFGVVIYEALTGKALFQFELPADQINAILEGRVTPLTQVRPELPEALGAVVARAIHPDRVQRYQRAGDVAVDFEAALRGARLQVPGQAVELAAERVSSPPTRQHPRHVSSAPETSATPATISIPPPTRVHSSMPPPIPRRSRLLVVVIAGLGGLAVLAALFGLVVSAGILGIASMPDEPEKTSAAGGNAAGAPPVGAHPATPSTGAPAGASNTVLVPSAMTRASVVSVGSDPPGALVIVDGVAVGNTPIEVERPPNDLVAEIVLRMPGYQQQRVSISSLTTETLTVPLLLERSRRPRAPLPAPAPPALEPGGQPEVQSEPFPE